ncbi:MAG: hypothetical protein AB8G99_16750, partial [Planctomycetaceae bacterium]
REIVPTERLHPSGRGSLTYERFDDIPGGDVSDLTSHGRFPLSPDVADSLNSFEATADAGTDFGDRFRG